MSPWMWRGALGAGRENFPGHAAGKFTRSRGREISNRRKEERVLKWQPLSHLAHFNCALYFYITSHIYIILPPCDAPASFISCCCAHLRPRLCNVEGSIITFTVKMTAMHCKRWPGHSERCISPWCRNTCWCDMKIIFQKHQLFCSEQPLLAVFNCSVLRSKPHIA